MKSVSHKKFWVLSLIGVFLIVSAFTSPQQQAPPHKNNLKILPKNISHDDLMAVMHGFEHALGMKCGGCHAPSKTDPTKLDFASDDNHHKVVALEMMKMTRKINAKDFKIKGDFAANYINDNYKVSCNTCHNGQKHPATLTPADKERKAAPHGH